MKKTLLSVGTAVLLCGGNLYAADSFEEAFKNGELSGQARLAFIHNDPETGTSNYATAVGGRFKYETAMYENMQFGAAAYVSQKIALLSGDKGDNKLAGDFFDNDQNSFVYFGEAYLNYQRDAINFKIGRLAIDTPFADTDDIRMNQNTFEAAVISYSGIENTTLVGGYITRWAGIDSGDDISKFKKLVDNGDGALALGVVNSSIENLELQGWIYDVDQLTRILYADGAFTTNADTVELELAAQAGIFSEDAASGVDGEVIGLAAGATFGPGSVSFAYNRASNDAGKAVVNGFGGGPYFTSMEEMTIEGLTDARAYVLGLEMDFSHAGMPELGLSYAYGDFENGAGDEEYSEHDLIVTYAINDKADIEASYAYIDDDSSDPVDDGFSRFLVRANYNF